MRQHQALPPIPAQQYHADTHPARVDRKASANGDLVKITIFL